MKAIGEKKEHETFSIKMKFSFPGKILTLLIYQFQNLR